MPEYFKLLHQETKYLDLLKEQKDPRCGKIKKDIASFKGYQEICKKRYVGNPKKIAYCIQQTGEGFERLKQQSKKMGC